MPSGAPGKELLLRAKVLGKGSLPQSSSEGPNGGVPGPGERSSYPVTYRLSQQGQESAVPCSAGTVEEASLEEDTSEQRRRKE